MIASEIHDDMLRTLAESIFLCATVTCWIREFKHGRDSVNPFDTIKTYISHGIGPPHETIPMGQNYFKNKYCLDKCVPIKNVEEIQYGVTKIYLKHIYDIDFLVLN